MDDYEFLNRKERKIIAKHTKLKPLTCSLQPLGKIFATFAVKLIYNKIKL
jgi:hypothetical protein